MIDHSNNSKSQVQSTNKYRNTANSGTRTDATANNAHQAFNSDKVKKFQATVAVNPTIDFDKKVQLETQQQQLVKLKIKRKYNQGQNERVKDNIKTEEQLKNDQAQAQTLQNERKINLNEKKPLGNNKIQGVEEAYYDLSKSPFNQESLNYRTLALKQDALQQPQILTQDEIEIETQEIDQEIKIPAFLSRSSLEKKDKNHQFYMTQIINQSRQVPTSSYMNVTQSSQNHQITNQSIQALNPIKQSRSQVKQGSKKSSSTSISKTQIIKNLQKKKQISPINNITRKVQLQQQQPINILDKYVNFSNSSNIKMQNRDHIIPNNRQTLNASALIVNSQKDFLNATAPLNMTQIHKMYNDEAMMALGLSDAVNSTQNLNRMNSKESWKEGNNFNLTSYYDVQIKDPKRSLKSAVNMTQLSISPTKDKQKKHMLIQSILGQDALSNSQNKKYFLNLTLQQLIQQQKQAQTNNQALQGDQRGQYNQSASIKRSFKNNKRLNKTLDNFRDNYANIYYNSNLSNDKTNLRTFVNNFIQNGQISQQQQVASKKLTATNSKNKFSNTMKFSDFNQTQIIETRSNHSNKKQKNSLKSTQNLNFQDDNSNTNTFCNTQIQNPRKYSALSTYSMNTALPTTSHQNQTKSRKIVSNKKDQVNGTNSENQLNKLKHKRQGSQDKDAIDQILNFYQDDIIQQIQNNDPKNKTFQGNPKSSQNIYQTQIKHKTNSTLNNYLQNSGKQQKSNQGKKEKASLNNSFLSIAKNQPYNTHGIHTEIKNYDNYNIKNDANNSNNAISYKKNDIQIKNIKPKDLNVYQNEFKDEPRKHIAQQRNDYDIKSNPYAPNKKSNSQAKKENKEIQNKTQPIPRQLLEMAQAEAINFSTGTSIIINKQPSKESAGKPRKQQLNSNNNQTYQQKQKQLEDQQIKPKIGRRKDVEIAKVPKDEDPSAIYNNKNTVILEEFIDQNQNSDDEVQVNGKMNSKLDRFILGKQIGQGAYAVVRVATMKKDNKKYAIKIYDKSKLTDVNRQRSVRREIKLLQKMNHQNIVKIYEAFETESHVYLVMDYVGGGSLHSYLKERPSRRLEEEEAKRIFKQILTALQYCHRKSITHRDIKLENILLDDNKNVKLIDFGFSTCIPNDKKIKMFCGTPSYMAPEIVLKEEYAGPPADIWASGVLLYALMNGCFPFRGSTDKELYRRIQRGTFIMHNQHASDLLIEFLQKMINVNADLRPTSEELLQHEWFKVNSNSTLISNQDMKIESIQDQKKLFKAKILAKIPVEKTKNTICLLSSNDKMSGQKGNTHNLNLAAINTNTQQNPVSQFKNNIMLQNDISDYGLNQTNVMKRLNQEAYQAYYNTSGGNFGLNQNTANIQNPYYNNFFATNPAQNYMGPNTQATNQPLNLAFYPSNLQGQLQRSSPTKQQQQQQTSGISINTNPVIFPLNFNQQAPNHVGTPQVFASPTGFAQIQPNYINNQKDKPEAEKQHQQKDPMILSPHQQNEGQNNQSGYYVGTTVNPVNGAQPQVSVIELRGSLFDQVQQQINNNQQKNQPTYFNIINNITQVTCLPQPNTQIGNQLINHISPQYQKETNIIIDSGSNSDANGLYNNQNDQEKQGIQADFDEGIIDSIIQLGYHRSHVVSQLENDNSNISNLYAKLKEEKMSMTQQNRPLSLQPHSRRGYNALVGNVYQGMNHNKGIFPPNFVPSIPDSIKALGDNGGGLLGQDESNNEDEIIGCNIIRVVQGNGVTNEIGEYGSLSPRITSIVSSAKS